MICTLSSPQNWLYPPPPSLSNYCQRMTSLKHWHLHKITPLNKNYTLPMWMHKITKKQRSPPPPLSCFDLSDKSFHQKSWPIQPSPPTKLVKPPKMYPFSRLAAKSDPCPPWSKSPPPPPTPLIKVPPPPWSMYPPPPPDQCVPPPPLINVPPPPPSSMCPPPPSSMYPPPPHQCAPTQCAPPTTTPLINVPPSHLALIHGLHCIYMAGVSVYSDVVYCRAYYSGYSTSQYGYLTEMEHP